MLYRTAKTYAEEIREQLYQLCSAITIAGSIRRHEPLCGDIDLVCLATDSQRAKVRQRCLRRNPKVISDGEHILSIVINNGVRLQVNFAKPTTTDLFAPVPGNWGSILMMRTGPKTFNQEICLKAAKMGFCWKPFVGIVKNNNIIASETEEDIFSALNLTYIQPDCRKYGIKMQRAVI